MSDLNTERLQFLNESYSQSAISELTGIPRSTLSYVLRDQRSLPSKYIESTRDNYLADAFERLVEHGAPFKTSSTFLNSPVSTIRKTLDDLDEVANFITEGRVASFSYQTGQTLTANQVNDMIGQVHEDVLQSMRFTSKNVEDVLEYNSVEDKYL